MTPQRIDQILHEMVWDTLLYGRSAVRVTAEGMERVTWDEMQADEPEQEHAE